MIKNFLKARTILLVSATTYFIADIFSYISGIEFLKLVGLFCSPIGIATLVREMKEENKN